jgi:predicted Zn-ribbon and HTH transcriptional regulator
MGMMTAIHCDGCGYHLKDMIHGADSGMRSEVQAISCPDCENLGTILVSTRGELVMVDGKWRSDLQINTNPRCPHCGGTRFVPWRLPGPCPRCKSEMYAVPNTMIFWD